MYSLPHDILSVIILKLICLQRTGLCIYTAVVNFSDVGGINDLDLEEETTTENMHISDSQQDLNLLRWYF